MRVTRSVRHTKEPASSLLWFGVVRGGMKMNIPVSICATDAILPDELVIGVKAIDPSFMCVNSNQRMAK